MSGHRHPPRHTNGNHPMVVYGGPPFTEYPPPPMREYASPTTAMNGVPFMREYPPPPLRDYPPPVIMGLPPHALVTRAPPRKSKKSKTRLEPPVMYHPGPYIGPMPPWGMPVFDAPHGDSQHRRVRSSERAKRSPSTERRDRNGRHSPLQQWEAWRQHVNGALSEGLVRNRYQQIPVSEDVQRLAEPYNRHSIYHYSTAIDQGTTLQKEDYLNFGIPRAQVPKPKNRAERESSLISSSSESSDSERNDRRPFYSIDKIRHQTGLDDLQRMGAEGHAPDGYIRRERRGSNPEIRSGRQGPAVLPKPAREYR